MSRLGPRVKDAPAYPTRQGAGAHRAPPPPGPPPGPAYQVAGAGSGWRTWAVSFAGGMCRSSDGTPRRIGNFFTIRI
jgi:hypothetical protein